MLKKAIKKYGKENFRRDIISFADTFEELNRQEKELISFFNATTSDDFYNIEEGGWSYPLSEHTKELIKQNHAHLFGKNNPRYGRTVTEETRRRMSEGSKGRIPCNKGVPMSDEQKEKLKQAWKTRLKTVSNHRVIKCVETGQIFNSVMDASKELNLKYYSIFAVLSGRRNSLYGKTFIYLESEVN